MVRFSEFSLRKKYAKNWGKLKEILGETEGNIGGN
jgi:hypothetical protein